MSALFLDCTEDQVPHWHAVLKPGDPEIVVNLCAGQPDNLFVLIGGYSILVNDHTYFTAETLARCTDLKRIVFLGTGASSFIDVDAAAKLGIAIDTIKGYGDITVAEHAITLAMAAARNVAQMDREVRAGQWRQIPGVQVFGKTFGIIGYGGIGREVARIAAGIGMRVLIWNRSPVAGVTTVSLDEVLAQSDILSVHLGLNDATRGFLDAEKLGKTKPGVIFINTARADVVRAEALSALLRSGHIGHAAIDVFSPEPPERDDPLLSLPRVTVTAHAGFMTPEASMTMLRRAIDYVIAAGDTGRRNA